MASNPLARGDIRRAHPNFYKGTASEYLAASYFLKKHWQVYWPSCHQTCVDFVAEDGKGKFHKVQVKTATWIYVGGFSYLQCSTGLRKDHNYKPRDLYDVLVILYEDNMWIIPSPLIKTTTLSLGGTNPRYKKTIWEPYKIAH